jgi:hypothetical protein
MVKVTETNYRVGRAVSGFVIIDHDGKEVGSYSTRQEAIDDLDGCRREEAMFETAKTLLDIAVKTLMQMHGVDRDMARAWISSAMNIT